MDCRRGVDAGLDGVALLAAIESRESGTGSIPLWLSDVFAPVPAVHLGAPEGLDCCPSISGIDAAADPDRAARDRLNLDVMLGRREVPSTPSPSPEPAPRKRRRTWRR